MESAKRLENQSLGSAVGSDQAQGQHGTKGTARPAPHTEQTEDSPGGDLSCPHATGCRGNEEGITPFPGAGILK